MKNLYYYSATLIFYAVIIIGAISIKDITTIFDFVSAISISAIAFFIPSIFYLRIKKIFPQDLPNEKQNTYLAKFFFCMGIINFILGMMSTIFNILGIE